MSPEMQIAITFDLTETDALVLSKAIRAYGDTRERAGIERAAKECDDVGERTMASLIRDLSVPAPDAKESEVRE